MTITNTRVKQRYNCDGSVTSFAIPFDFQESDEVTVYLRDESVSPITETLLTEGALPNGEYTLTGGPPVTTVETNSAYASTYKIVIKRATDQTQEIEYSDNDAFPAEVTGDGLDKLTQLIQEIAEELDRAILLPVSSDLSQLRYPDPLPYGYLRWNDLGTDVEGNPFIVTAPLSFDEITSTFSIPAATASVDGYLSAALYVLIQNAIQTGGGHIVDADVSAAAAIQLSKLAALTASRVLVSSAGGVISASSTTATEIGYVSGASSNLQAQINAIASASGSIVSVGSTASPQSITSAGGITHAGNQRELHFIVSNGGAVSVAANPQISVGSIVGQELDITGTSDTDYITLVHGTGLVMNGDCVLKNGSYLSFIWNGSAWAEKSRNSL